MIRRLKAKFILTNMILLTVVIVAAFATIYVYTANDLRSSSISAMRDIASTGYRGIDDLFSAGKEQDNKYPYLTTYTIDLNEINNTCYIDGFGSAEELSEEKIEYINKLINTVNRSDKNEGVLDEYNLRFFYVPNTLGKRIVLLDKSYEDDALLRLVVSFSVVGLIALTCFFLISVAVARLAVKPVERSLKQQQQLVADASHELKTPITVISANADIILSHGDDTVENQRKWIEYIKDESQRMSALVNNMLYLAKTDESVVTEILTDTDLSSAAYEVALPFESICFEKGKTLDINIVPDVFIHAQEKAIKQLIVILLDNAVKYSDEHGTVRLLIRADSDKAHISVMNSGNPIPKDDIPNIFERFYRVDESRSREQGGYGLGLSIAKRIIETNEGKISVSSSAENGTVFTCSFKRSKPPKKQTLSFD